MKLALAVLAAGALIGASCLAQAEDRETPGHEMQEHGSVKGSPGASGYTPGHEMRKEHGTTGMGGDRDDFRRGDRDDVRRDRDDRHTKLKGDHDRDDAIRDRDDMHSRP